MRKRLREDIDELDPICNQAVGWGELLTVVTLLRPALLLIVRKTRRTSNGEGSLVGERSGERARTAPEERVSLETIRSSSWMPRWRRNGGTRGRS